MEMQAMGKGGAAVVINKDNNPIEIWRKRMRRIKIAVVVIFIVAIICIAIGIAVLVKFWDKWSTKRGIPITGLVFLLFGVLLIFMAVCLICIVVRVVEGQQKNSTDHANPEDLQKLNYPRQKFTADGQPPPDKEKDPDAAPLV